MAGTQFCPRCVQALEAIVSADGVELPPVAAATG
jgi:hypothetical protein